MLESCHEACCLMHFLARRREKTFLLGNVVWQRPTARTHDIFWCFGWFRLYCVQVPTGHEKDGDGGGDSLSDGERLFFNLEPSFWKCFVQCFEVIVFCHSHVHLGGIPLIESLKFYHILSYQSYPVMSRSFLQLDSNGSLSIHRFLPVHQGTAVSGELLEAQITNSWDFRAIFQFLVMKRAETCQGEATSHRGSKIEPQVGKSSTSTIFKHSICKSVGQDVSQSFFLKFWGVFVCFCVGLVD